MREYSFTVDYLTDSGTVDAYLRRVLCLSGTVIKRVKYGGIRKNGEVVTVRAALSPGDMIEISLPEENSENVTPADVPLRIVYEDDYILCVDKSSGMPTHPSRGNHITTLAEAVSFYMGGQFVFRAVNRLDRDTSGLVLISKDMISATLLGRAMKNGEFSKTYTARLVGVPTPSSGRVDAPIERETPDSQKRTVRADGRPSVTDYSVRTVCPGGCICTLRPHTGRTHQLRVHMAYIGHPLYADAMYGTALPGETFSLRCTSMTFPHPATGESMTVTLRGDNCPL